MQVQSPDAQPFRFSDPQQQRIYEELREVVGRGPADFFRDACVLMAGGHQLKTTAHLVAHLLREIESAIRAVYRPVIEEERVRSEGSADQGPGRESQKQQICAILQSLKISQNSVEARAWNTLAENLNRFAHRRGLEAPYSLNEIEKLWAQCTPLLDALLKGLRERFLRLVRELDKILANGTPSEAVLKRLTQEIPNTVATRNYLFTRLENPEWLDPLRKKRFFQYPPEPIYEENDGPIAFPPWPEGRYLARMAQHNPKLVAEIIEEMTDTKNVVVQTDLLDALLAMSPDLSAPLVNKVERWAQSPYLRFFPPLPKQLGQLIAHWAEGKRACEALRVARVLFGFVPEQSPAAPAPNAANSFPREPQSRFDPYLYGDFLSTYYPKLAAAAGLPALELVCDLLDQAIRLPNPHLDEQTGQDYSAVWCPSIAEHPGNPDSPIKLPLVRMVRDAAECIVRSQKASIEDVVNELERRRWKIFRRIALHLLIVFPGQAEALAAKRLKDQNLLTDKCLRYEYDQLLKARFLRLPPADCTNILALIEAGPGEGGEREIWQRDRLAQIGPENLPGDWQRRYQDLVGRHGAPTDSKFLMSRKSWWLAKSPKTVDELKEMTVADIVRFLQGRKSASDHTLPLFEEMPDENLLRVVTEDPARFADAAAQFRGLAPNYIRAVISGFRGALNQGKNFAWEPVLDLCEWVLAQLRQIPNSPAHAQGASPPWGWTRKAIAELLTVGFNDAAGAIPICLRRRVWKILKPITDDLNPTPHYERPYDTDPAEFALNTTRGAAMHAVIRYALWLRQHWVKAPKAGARLSNGLKKMPEVRKVLEAHLDPNREPSRAIRAVYGQWFPWLTVLDPSWARAQAARIFPQDPESEAYFEAAWNTYLAYNGVCDAVWEILRPQYDYAVMRIGTRRGAAHWRENPDEKLAEHLMVLYRRGKLALNDPVLTMFWQKASDELRAHALAFVGKALQRAGGNIPGEKQERLKLLWEHRLTAAKAASSALDFQQEIAAFAWWTLSDTFAIDWTIEQLAESFRFSSKTPRSIAVLPGVLDYLAKAVATHPQKCLDCLKIILAGNRASWEASFYAREDSVRKILGYALQNHETAAEAKNIINVLGSKGFLQYKNLLN